MRLLTKLMQNGHGTCERGKKNFFLTTDFKTDQVSILKIGLQQVKGSSLNTRSSNNLNLLKMNIKREFEI